MTDDISKVVKFLLGEGELRGARFGERPTDTTAPIIPAYWWRKELRAAFDRLEPTPAEVGEYTHAQRESMIAAMRRDAAEYCLFGLDYLSSAAHDYATLARQLAEAKAEIAAHERNDLAATDLIHSLQQRLEQAESQLAAATPKDQPAQGVDGE